MSRKNSKNHRNCGAKRKIKSFRHKTEGWWSGLSDIRWWLDWFFTFLCIAAPKILENLDLLLHHF